MSAAPSAGSPFAEPFVEPARSIPLRWGNYTARYTLGLALTLVGPFVYLLTFSNNFQNWYRSYGLDGNSAYGDGWAPPPNPLILIVLIGLTLPLLIVQLGSLAVLPATSVQRAFAGAFYAVEFLALIASDYLAYTAGFGFSQIVNILLALGYFGAAIGAWLAVRGRPRRRPSRASWPNSTQNTRTASSTAPI